MINPWFKFYGSEYLSDPKIGALNAQERSCWVTLLCLASTSSTPGLIEFLTVEVLLDKSGIHYDPYHPEEWNACLGILAKFENMKMLKTSTNGEVEIVNWSKRQESAMSVTERVRKYRAKQRENTENVTDVTNCNVTANDRIEENRIEENRIDIVKTKKFKKPEIQELIAYCEERKNNVDPQKFFNYYESKGWMVGKSPMKDWKAAVRTWEGNEFDNKTTATPIKKGKYNHL